ncbi:hypothetical protein [Nocardia miyunensis]|uniref:hypothetical protein n=1 Tax=Nocardia miyunensis TaxID=282684 RepID=UPI000836A4A9|nr:hypothetical protein [Nocardia miyunensis]
MDHGTQVVPLTAADAGEILIPLRAAETAVPHTVTQLRLFTGEKSSANLRVYHRFGYTEGARTPSAAITWSIWRNPYARHPRKVL